MLARDEWAHLRCRIGTRADLQLGKPVLDGVDELVAHAANGNDHGDRHAALPG